jgi:anti-sigma regulatory factor (Ser/Thr protein kinase)
MSCEIPGHCGVWASGLPAQAGALTLIRGEVRRWLALLEVLPEAEADLVLAVNEAAANVIDRAYRTGADRAVVEVFFWTEPGAVLFEVVDHGRWRPPGSHTAGGATESRSCNASSTLC